MNQMPRPDGMRMAPGEQPRSEPLQLNSDEKHAGIVHGMVLTLARALFVLMEDAGGNISQGFSAPLPGRVMDYERALHHARGSAMRNMDRSRERTARAVAPRPAGEDRRGSGAVRYGG